MSDYNPADHSVAEVEAYVSENPAQAKTVLEAEQARGDDARKTLVAALQKVVDGQQEAPVPTEPTAVTVEPAATPSNPGLLDQFERTPERGFRKKS